MKAASKAKGKFSDAKDFLHSRWVELAKTKGAEEKVRKEFAQWVQSAKDSELVKRARQLWDHLNSGKVTTTEKVIIVAALLYLISPVDLIPDAVPVLGWLDDLGVAAYALNFVLDRLDSGKKKGKGNDKHKAKHAGRHAADRAGEVLKAFRKAFR